jgi:hypothetical protein
VATQEGRRAPEIVFLASLLPTLGPIRQASKLKRPLEAAHRGGDGLRQLDLGMTRPEPARFST